MSNLIAFPTADSPSEQVAANVRAAMARVGVRQRPLAAQLGISQAAVSARFTGKTPWTIDELAALASLLNTSLSALVEIERPQQDSNLQPTDCMVIDLHQYRSARAA